MCIRDRGDIAPHGPHIMRAAVCGQIDIYQGNDLVILMRDRLGGCLLYTSCNGAPKVSKPLTIKNSTKTRSPFVALADRK